MTAIQFTISADKADANDRGRFYEAKVAHFQRLLNARIPGAAWHRHQLRVARAAMGKEADSSVDRPRRNNWRDNELADTCALFTGGRAMSENLQLDRVLLMNETSKGTVALDTITGITIEEIDWSDLIKGKDPKIDLLAVHVPYDQHVLFFPSFAAVIALSDETKENGPPVLQAAEPRSEDANTVKRYERQLGVSMTAFARLIGPKVIRTVAVTGSDPYFRTGTDVAVLFEAKDVAALEKLLAAQVMLTAKSCPDAKPVHGDLLGVAYTGYRSPDRAVCSYRATLGETVIVTNSVAQLERLIEVHHKKLDSLAGLEEYTFFRDRYTLGDEGETAFLFLSDATIRRWCGPRWRIATSRRTRDMAVIAELQATHMGRLVEGDVKSGPIYTDLPTSGIGELELTPQGVRSESYGSLDFMTPIVEIPMDKVTGAKAEAYRRWKRGYERNWQWAFDPIGLRLTVHDKKLAADMTVMPLIAGSDYRQMIAVTQGVAFAHDAGDPHDALAHGILAVNVESPPMRQLSGMASFIAPKLKVDPLSWLGQYITLYADNDPFWGELAKTPRDDMEEFFEENLGRLPVVFQADVKSGFKLTAFLVSLRAFIEQTAPGMTVWENETYKEQDYVKVSPSEKTKRQDEEIENLTICYAATGDALIISLSETSLQRALDRRLAREQAQADGQPLATKDEAKTWIGKNVGFRFDRPFIEMMAYLTREDYQANMRSLAWGNLPILNTWKQLYPGQDPVAVHERIWQTQLICPGGGQYAWNETWQTMESTVYGHPGEPKTGPVAPGVLQTILGANFGLTFEDQGLRARAVLERKP